MYPQKERKEGKDDDEISKRAEERLPNDMPVYQTKGSSF
jgi:hypothetical protein